MDVDAQQQQEIVALVEERVAAEVEARLAPLVAEAVQHALWSPRVYGDERKLHLHPTAVVNDALFNLSSGEITVEEYAFFGHGVSILTGTHDITLFDRERQVGVPEERPGRGDRPRRRGSRRTPWCWGRAGSASTPWSRRAAWCARTCRPTRWWAACPLACCR